MANTKAITMLDISFNLSLSTNYYSYVGLLSGLEAGQQLDNIIIKGKIEINSTGYVVYSYLSGLVAYTKMPIALTNISISGL